MKKIVILMSMCLFVGFSTMAQDVEEGFNAAYASKRGVYLLPQAGDFALGVEATPFLEYLGNIFTSSFNYAPIFDGVDQTLYGKYFLQDDRAIRARLTLNVANRAIKGGVLDQVDPDVTLLDVQHITTADIQLGLGYEFRRGHGRVQGFYGGEAILGVRSNKTKYDWANPMTDTYTNPTSVDFVDGGFFNPTTRITESKSGMNIFVGVGAFGGVEYFIAPQISIGGELGLGINFGLSTQGETTTERWDVVDDQKVTKTTKGQLGSSWDAQRIGLGTRVSGGIFLMFHF